MRIFIYLALTIAVVLVSPWFKILYKYYAPDSEIQIQKSFILLSEEYIHFTLLKQVN